MPGWVTTVLEESSDELLATAVAVRRFRGEVRERRDPTGAGGDDAVVTAARRTAAPLEPFAVAHASHRPSRRG